MFEQREVRHYVSVNGRLPFREWLVKLKDIKGQQIIDAKIRKLAQGYWGNCKYVGDIFELKIYYGPGYRLYFGIHGGTAVVLLNGGDKGTQRSDIEKAKDYWADFKRRNR